MGLLQANFFIFYFIFPRHWFSWCEHLFIGHGLVLNFRPMCIWDGHELNSTPKFLIGKWAGLVPNPTCSCPQKLVLGINYRLPFLFYRDFYDWNCDSWTICLILLTDFVANLQSVGHIGEKYDPCTAEHSIVYFNLPEVQKALHVDPAVAPSQWVTCRYDCCVFLKLDVFSFLKVIKEALSSKEKRLSKHKISVKI